jgi:hypothetical protein
MMWWKDGEETLTTKNAVKLDREYISDEMNLNHFPVSCCHNFRLRFDKVVSLSAEPALAFLDIQLCSLFSIYQVDVLSLQIRTYIHVGLFSVNVQGEFAFVRRRQ